MNRERKKGESFKAYRKSQDKEEAAIRFRLRFGVRFIHKHDQTNAVPFRKA